MQVLTIGGTGFLGRAVTRELIDRGSDVVCLDIAPKEEFADQFENVTVAKGDVTDYDEVAAAMEAYDPDCVINFAYLLGAETESDPRAAMEVNVTGVNNVFHAAAEHGVDRAIYTSSMAVYGLPDTHSGTVAEDDLAPAAYCEYPVMLYAATKQLNEYQAKLYDDEYDTDVVTIRPSTVYGPGREAGYTSWTSDIFTETVDDGTVYIPDQPDKRMSLVPRFDAASLYASVALADEVQHRAYNTGGHCVTAGEIASTVEEELGGEVVCDPDRPGRYAHVADVSHDRAREEFGYELTPLRESIRRYGDQVANTV